MASLPTSAAGGQRRTRLSSRASSLISDRPTIALALVFVLACAFYLGRGNYAEPFALHGGSSSPYNRLADAFLHFHLWVVHVPEGILGSGNPYNPAERPAFLFGFPDYALYGHYLYITWGPAPVLVWLVPLHLLGLEPSGSAIAAPFAIVGLGFALATLRVILRQIGRVSLWLCMLAGLTLACASVLPYLLRFPFVYQEALAAGYCFAMGGIWGAVSAVAAHRASLKHLVFTSLCIGLATATRPTLGLLGLLLVPVYLSLRSTRPRRGLLASSLAPFGACLLLLGAYNFARFGDPFQYGTEYQINGITTYTAHYGKLSYLAPGLWSYLIPPPRIGALFPFVFIDYPQVSYPFALPTHYLSISEETGGLLAMAPIAVFLAALPWLWRRRPALLGSLVPVLLVMAVAGIACTIFLAYEFGDSTERYETDYITLLLFGSISAWLALSHQLRGRARALVRAGGGLLAAWSCVAGVAISYQEIEKHPSTWRTLVDLGSPVSTAITAMAGRPILAEVYTPNILRAPPGYGDYGTEVTGFSLTANDEADITIVSPDSRADALIANTVVGPALQAAFLVVRVVGPGRASHVYRLSAKRQRVRMPIRLKAGINQLVLTPVTNPAGTVTLSPELESQYLMTFSDFALASS